MSALSGLAHPDDEIWEDESADEGTVVPEATPQGESTPSPATEQLGAQVSTTVATGAGAAELLQQQARTVPSSTRPARWGAHFAASQADKQWNDEFDRGRLKKVRARRDDSFGSHNRFQETANLRAKTPMTQPDHDGTARKRRREEL